MIFCAKNFNFDSNHFLLIPLVLWLSFFSVFSWGRVGRWAESAVPAVLHKRKTTKMNSVPQTTTRCQQRGKGRVELLEWKKRGFVTRCRGFEGRGVRGRSFCQVFLGWNYASSRHFLLGRGCFNPRCHFHSFIFIFITLHYTTLYYTTLQHHTFTSTSTSTSALALCSPSPTPVPSPMHRVGALLCEVSANWCGHTQTLCVGPLPRREVARLWMLRKRKGSKKKKKK